MSEEPTISEFTRQVERTDRRPELDRLRIAVLGIFGELGSLMSEIKKGVREGPKYISFRTTLVEEAGDLLWYFAALSLTMGSCPTSWCKLVSVITTTSGFSRMVMLPRRAG
jgi:NTP pyrophosphatase (non-canonical NTP hydrolase)